MANPLDGDVLLVTKICEARRILTSRSNFISTILPSTCEKIGVMALQLIGGAILGGFFQSVFQELTLILHKGLGRRWELNLELEKLKRKLAKVQAVIDDAEMRRYTEPDVNFWVDDLRELMYNIDNTVGEINTRQLELEKAAKSKDEVRDIFSFAIDKAQEVQFKQTIKSMIKGFLDRLDEFAKEANDLGLKRNSSGWSSGLSQVRVRPQTSPSIDESEVYGREKDKEIIIKLLFAEGSEQNKKNYGVIPIVGMGGVGKTTLSQLVFQDERVKSEFDLRSWASVSDVFDVSKVTKELVEYSTKDKCSDMELSLLQDRLENMVRGKRFFIVLDDIWTVKEWDSMKAPLSHCAKGSILLITTRDKAVAEAIGNKPPYELGILDDEQCWNLFKGKAFGKVDADVDENLVQLGKGIVQKCKGVPLAVKVLGAMLQGAEPERWEAVLRNELWHLQNDRDDQIFPALRLSYHYLSSPLKRCFEYLSLFPTDYVFDEENLVFMWIGEGFVEAEKGMILEDIGKQYFIDLKRRCLIQKDNQIHDLVHSLACTISAEFYCRLQSDEKSCKSLARAHHASVFVNEVVEGQTMLLAEATCLRTMMFFGWNSRSLLEKFKEWRWLRVVDLRRSGISELPSSISNLRHLRYLNVSVNYRLRSLPDAVCQLYNFQYLNLARCKITELPKELGNLLNLRYLNLSYSGISNLPNSICKLFNLQVLDLSHCHSLAELPESIGDLHSLRKLDLRGCAISCVPDSILKATNLQSLHNSSGSSVPAYLGKLTGLQELGEYPVRKETGREIGDLKDMNNLRGRLVISGLENIESVEEAEMADMKCKKHITHLRFEWCNVRREDALVVRDGPLEVKVLEALEPHPKNLTLLHFSNYSGDMFPRWIYKNHFFSLKCLRINGLHRVSRLVGIELPSLMCLTIRKCPRLREVSMAAAKLIDLTVIDCQEIKLTAISLFAPFQVGTSVNLMPSLEYLCTDSSQLDCLPLLQQAAAPAGHHGVPLKLKNLRVEGCQNNRISFTTLCNLTSLETLQICNFSEVQLPLKDDDQGSFPSLTKLIIYNCNNLTCLPKALRNQTSLKDLSISRCPQLTTFEEEGLPTSLLTLSIYNCEIMTNLPKGLYNLTSLVTLDVGRCPQIEVQLDDRLPPRLQKFHLYNCPKVEQQLEQESRTGWPVLDFILKSRTLRRN